MAPKSKGFHEEFARFFEQPTREGLRDLLKRNVGEFAYCDFKENWPAHSKTARHILGIANSGGGCMVIGVRQKKDKSLESIGLKTLTDKTDVLNGIQKFLPDLLFSTLSNSILDFPFEESEYPAIKGKKFQVLFVGDDPKHIPFIATADGEGIRKPGIYVRRGSATEEANHEELQGIINRRLETGYSSQREIDLSTHLGQLQVLYGHLNKYHYSGGITQGIAAMLTPIFKGEPIPNPSYPQEEYEDFVVRMIKKKKRLIEMVLNVQELS